jgi:hypothetical protein
LQSALEGTIDIPVLSWLYPKISNGDPLTVIDLFSLMMAMPVTILYKVLLGGANANPPFTSAQVDQIVTQKVQWPSIAEIAGGAGSTRTPNAPGDSWATWASTIAGLIAILTLPGEVANDVAAFQNLPSPPLSILNVVFGLAGQAFGAPYRIFDKTSAWTPAECQLVRLWVTRFLPLMLNIAFVTMSQKRSLAQYTKEYGLPAISGVGLFVLLTGVDVAINDPGQPLQQAQAVVAKAQLPFKLLLQTKNNYALIAVLAFDLLCDAANGALTLIQAFPSSTRDEAPPRALLSGAAVPA